VTGARDLEEWAELGRQLKARDPVVFRVWLVGLRCVVEAKPGEAGMAMLDRIVEAARREPWPLASVLVAVRGLALLVPNVPADFEARLVAARCVGGAA
jgi:hypothetical protein